MAEKNLKAIFNILTHLGNANQNYFEISCNTNQNIQDQQNKRRLVLARMQSNNNINTLLMGIETCIATMKISVVVAQGAESRCASRSSYTHLGHIPKRCFLLLHSHLLNNIHCCSIHNNQKFGNHLDVHQQIK